MFPEYYEFHFPVKIISGHHALQSLPNELHTLGVDRPMILTDQGVKRAGLVDLVLNSLAESGIIVGALFDQVPPESSTATINGVGQIYHGKECNGLIAVGGGSVIDTAKGVNIIVSLKGDDILAYQGADIISNVLSPLIVIPTTAGTGSEATNVAVIVDEKTHAKLSFVSQHLLPDVAILDSHLTLTLPPKLTAATGMDALTHAIEASICIQKNPMSDAYAWGAIKIIGENLLRTVKNPQDRNLRLMLANASTMAGAAFSNSMVGCVHSMGHAAGSVARIPHGVAMNIFLPHGLEFNLEVKRNEIGELLLPLAGNETYLQTKESSHAEKVIEIIMQLKSDLHQLAGLPRTLAEAGVRKEQLPDIAKLAINDGSAVMNPVELGLDEAMKILKAAYD
jgi:alcohol dehydrogenase